MLSDPESAIMKSSSGKRSRDSMGNLTDLDNPYKPTSQLYTAQSVTRRFSWKRSAAFCFRVTLTGTAVSAACCLMLCFALSKGHAPSHYYATFGLLGSVAGLVGGLISSWMIILFRLMIPDTCRPIN